MNVDALCKFRRAVRSLTILGLGCLALHAQDRLPGTPLLTSDLAALETREPRHDLNCTINALKPTLGFDLRFHSGYDVTLPLTEVAHSSTLVAVFRITAKKPNAEPVYFSQRFRVPSLDPGARGAADLQGKFDLGAGRYRVDWLLRDSSGRLCSQHWSLDAALSSRDRGLTLALAPGAAEASNEELFRPAPVLSAHDDNGLDVKVLVNFAPQNEDAVTLQPPEMYALMSVLRNIARDPRIKGISLVAFNLRSQRVLYRQENSGQIDFPALGTALQAPSTGTIDVKSLMRKHGDTEFLAKLISEETRRGEKPDALIFAGLKVALDDRLPQASLRQLGDPGFPIFYLNINSDPIGNPWRDTIGDAVKFLKGQEYAIVRPRDLWYAWKDLMSRVLTTGMNRRAFQ